MGFGLFRSISLLMAKKQFSIKC